MEQTWIITANAGRARIFSQAGNGALQEVDDLLNAAVRLRTSETERDRVGPTSAGKSIHNTGGATPNKQYEPPQSPEEHETELFARSVAARASEGHAAGQFNRLVLAASPQFLGILRKLLDARLKPLLAQEVNKDYTQMSAQQLREQLASMQGQQSS